MSDINKLTIHETTAGLKKGDFSVEQLVNSCFYQIKKEDFKIKAFLTLLEGRALVQAKEADKIIAKNNKVWEKQPLFGIPYACKDNFSTKDVRTTAGSKMLENYVPQFDSTVVKKLNDAGAILLGKTNMDAFAHGSSTETSDFFNTYNPWDLTRSPGGSSGGSAAAVAANMCIFAIGSETAGSIRGPASWCGVVGLKPSYGRVSRYGVVAMASSTDSPGPITKDVSDAALILEVISGNDTYDATSSDKKVDDYSRQLTSTRLDGVRIGKPKSYFGIDLELGVREALDNAISDLANLGAEIVEMDLIDPKYSIAVYTILQRSEVSSNLARLDGIRYGNDRNFFGFEAKKRMMLGAYTLSSGYYDEYYSKAQKVRTLLINDLRKAFTKVDMLVGPTMPCTATKIGDHKKMAMFGEMMDVLTEQSSIAGVCGISVPAGFSNNLPVGMMLIGNMFCEAKLLDVANVFQKNTKYNTIDSRKNL